MNVRFWDQYETWRKAWANLDKNQCYEFQELYLNSMYFFAYPQN